MTEPITIGYNTNKWVKDANTKMITLYVEDGNGAETMHVDGVNYVIPATKKLTILWLSTVKTGSAGVLRVYDSGSSDSATGTVKFSRYTYVSSDTQNNVLNYPTFMTFAAGNYPNFDGPASRSCIALGVEEDA